MSATTTVVPPPVAPAPAATPPPTRTGAVVVSVVTQVTFLLALAAGCVIAWAKGDYTFLTTMGGVAATNATAVVGYWVGGSDGEAKKSDLLSQQAQQAQAPRTGTTS